jgi:hypothetical protein
MVSQKDVFELIYDAAICFIPYEDLTDEQLERLDNITMKGCRCKLCTEKNYLGHANVWKLEICWSKPFFSDFLKHKFSMKQTLFEAIAVVLHEIIHILYPNYGEQQVRRKTLVWLKRNLWLDSYRKKILSKKELTKLGYTEQEV